MNTRKSPYPAAGRPCQAGSIDLASELEECQGKLLTALTDILRFAKIPSLTALEHAFYELLGRTGLKPGQALAGKVLTLAIAEATDDLEPLPDRPDRLASDALAGLNG